MVFAVLRLQALNRPERHKAPHRGCRLTNNPRSHAREGAVRGRKGPVHRRRRHPGHHSRQVLMALEELAGKPIHQLFDIIVGTSTGGILTLELTCPQPNGTARSAADARSLYLQRGASIFPLGGVPTVGTPPGGLQEKPLGVRAPLPAGATPAERMKHSMGWDNVAKVAAPLGGHGAQGNARYPAAPLEAELKEQLGDAMMSSALRPIAVVSCDLDRGTPLVFRGGGLPQGVLGDTQMRHVARATSAGPTFFPALQYRDAQQVTHQCVDGGLVANDPAMVGFVESQRQGALGEGGTLLVSVGTGETPDGKYGDADDVAQLAGTAPWWKVMTPVFKTLSGAPGILGRELLSSLPSVRYIRLQPTLAYGAVHAMDDVTPENTNALRLTGEAFVNSNHAALSELANALTETS